MDSFHGIKNLLQIEAGFVVVYLVSIWHRRLHRTVRCIGTAGHFHHKAQSRFLGCKRSCGVIEWEFLRGSPPPEGRLAAGGTHTKGKIAGRQIKGVKWGIHGDLSSRRPCFCHGVVALGGSYENKWPPGTLLVLINFDINSSYHDDIDL